MEHLKLEEVTPDNDQPLTEEQTEIKRLIEENKELRQKVKQMEDYCEWLEHEYLTCIDEATKELQSIKNNLVLFEPDEDDFSEWNPNADSDIESVDHEDKSV
uniref:EB1 C-terminal domain-containing protein n=1 Tax=Panagrellus redivivus TaxID=6233 RepID=A0A7E4VDJ2_PANRE